MVLKINLFVVLIGLNIISTIITQKIYICGKDKDVWITYDYHKHFKIYNNKTMSIKLEINETENNWYSIDSKNDLSIEFKEGTRYKIKCFNEHNNQLVSVSYVNSPIDLSYKLDTAGKNQELIISGFKNKHKIKSIKICMSNAKFWTNLCDEVNTNWKNKHFTNDFTYSELIEESLIFSTEKLTFSYCGFMQIKPDPVLAEPDGHTLIGLLQTQEGHLYFINFNKSMYPHLNKIQYNCLISDNQLTIDNINTNDKNINTQKHPTTDKVATNENRTKNTFITKEDTKSDETNNDSKKNSSSTEVIASSLFIIILLLLMISFFVYKFKVKRKRSINISNEEETLHLNINTTTSAMIEKVTDILQIEHAKIPTHFDLSMATIKKTATGNNNTALPYEFNRVKLSDDSYINASYIYDYRGGCKYIAAQQPQPSTKDNFINMIIQENVNVIVMLTDQDKNMESDYEYSSVNQIVQLYGTLLESQNYVDFNVKEYELQRGNECRKIIQLQYTQWEENSIPNSPHNYVNFIKFFRSQNYKSPIIIHCSTGVDKTGDFILCNYLLDLQDNNQELDYVAAVIHLRKHRLGLINQLIQYKFSHYVVKEVLKSSRKLIIDNFTNKTYNNTDLLSDLKHINNDPIDLIYTKQKHPLFMENKHKNRNKNAVLSCKGFLYLHPKNDYINANKLYHCGKSYICTQQPMKQTIGDFWRLIDQEGTQLILVLQEITNTEFWSTKKRFQVDYLKITANSQKFHDFYDEIELNLFNAKVNRNITLMYLKSWHKNKFPNLKNFISFFFQSISNDYKNVTIVCSDGSEACGIYLSFLKVLEQIKLEEAVDFCRAISMLRMYRSDFVNNLEQLQFLYNVTKANLHGDPEYSTID